MVRLANTRRVTSLEEFIAEVRTLGEKWEDLWFRGQNRTDWKLTPKIYRPRKQLDEDEIRLEFQRQGRQMVGNFVPSNKWEWYFLMQHFGAPTRLLDWTDGALIGLYFATRSNDGSTDAAVWALDPIWLNKMNRRVFRDWEGVAFYETPVVQPYLPDLFKTKLRVRPPVAIDPPHIAPRLAVQHSRFTLNGTDPEGFDNLILKDPRNSRLMKIEIAAESMQRIKGDLQRCGIIETTFFPELEALGRDLAANPPTL